MAVSARWSSSAVSAYLPCKRYVEARLAKGLATLGWLGPRSLYSIVRHIDRVLLP